jgi:nitroreductase
MTTRDSKGPKLAVDDITVPRTDVSVYQALYQRRMVWRFQDEAVPKDALERMLGAAVWAPNHRLTEPWRFFVVDVASPLRQELGNQAYEVSMDRRGDTGRAEVTRKSILDAPVLIYVYCVPGANDEVTQENYAAVCCAAHNISLAGVAEGLAVTWETGGATRHPKLQETLGAEEDWTLATMLSVGIPAESPGSVRTPATHFVHWHE